MQRIGACNKCGQCCGTNNINPWNSSWPECVNLWQAPDFFKAFPQSQLCGVTGESGKPLQIVMKGNAVVDGVDYPYEWGPGLHKPGSTECPFLKDDMECALHGTEHHWMWEQTCKDAPGPVMKQQEYERWLKNHPECSYEWIDG